MGEMIPYYFRQLEIASSLAVLRPQLSLALAKGKSFGAVSPSGWASKIRVECFNCTMAKSSWCPWGCHW